MGAVLECACKHDIKIEFHESLAPGTGIFTVLSGVGTPI